MEKRVSRTRKKNVEAIIDPIAEMATSAAEVAVVDHSSQAGSWMNWPVAEEPIITDDAFTGEEQVPSESEMAAQGAIAKLDTLSEAEENAVQALEAAEAVHEGPAEETPPVTLNQPDFDVAIETCDEDKVTETVFAIADQIDARAAFEISKGKDTGHNIHKTLKKARSLMVTKRAAKVLMVTNVDPAVINRTVHEGAAYNVYAIGKLADLVFGLTGGAVSNAINRAITKSLFQCKNGGVAFTGEMAKAAASDKLRIDPSLRKFLVSHTVSASTAPTQASSTMQALETLGVVKVVGSRKHPTYEVLDTPVARKLEELMLKAA